MLFNSIEFIYFFLPITIIGFYALAKIDYKLSISWLAFASITFYSYLAFDSLPILLLSILFNYYFAKLLTLRADENRKIYLWVGVLINLTGLAYFKYANFFVSNINDLIWTHSNVRIEELSIILPIGISFFTFTQIGYLVDCYFHKNEKQSFYSYVLFVTFFPHLIAGPLLQHRNIMPQFNDAKNYKINHHKIYFGALIFTMGLFKKTMLADPLGEYSDAIFKVVQNGGDLDIVIAWLGSIAYTFQLYFDFSGYSDMAVGLGLMFGMLIPINFDAPLKATSIIQFWQRWHISLSQFIREFVYIPMGGNKRGLQRKYINILVAMLLSGLWHGANWTFILWGGMHGIFLVINHLWRMVFKKTTIDARFLKTFLASLSWLITFLAVVVAFVMFRSENVHVALKMYEYMFNIYNLDIFLKLIENRNSGLSGISILIDGRDFNLSKLLLLESISFLVILVAPGIGLFLKAINGDYLSKIFFNMYIPVLAGIIFFICVLFINKTSNFLYFQF
jgi:alginate O-acetyltransferase complex protein AlgI